MHLRKISLQNFRSYTKREFVFDGESTVFVGPNTAGKSNLIEAIYLLSSGKSFRTDKKDMLVKAGEELSRASCSLEENDDSIRLEVVLTKGQVAGMKSQISRYLINGVSRRRADFAGVMPCVLFSPLDLDIISLGPSYRRQFLDQSLEQVSLEYRQAESIYTKALRQRNALLEHMRDTGEDNRKQLLYWDQIVIKNGEILTDFRRKFIEFVNNTEKELFDYTLEYDSSIISAERLKKYEKQEMAAGLTLVGPHRDDVLFTMKNNGESAEIKYFGSRGQQRLAVLQLKLKQLEYIKKNNSKNPILLMDDIFSELDDFHISHVLDIIKSQQTILTTTHKEFIYKARIKPDAIIEL